MFYKENFDFSILNSAISHLTEEEITELINQYYAGEKVKELIEQYNLNILTSKLVSIFPLVKVNIDCEFCKVPMTTKLNSKSSYEQLSRKDIICPKCQHLQNKLCKCIKCIEKSKLEELEKKHKQDSLNNKKNCLSRTITKYTSRS